MFGKSISEYAVGHQQYLAGARDITWAFVKRLMQDNPDTQCYSEVMVMMFELTKQSAQSPSFNVDQVTQKIRMVQHILHAECALVGLVGVKNAILIVGTGAHSDIRPSDEYESVVNKVYNTVCAECGETVFIVPETMTVH